MSNIYIQEPPALGKVLLKTTVGEIDIELWTKEAPKACRNFIQLCLEGYYNGTIFHRVVPDFIAQGGDPHGDGTGGESIYGTPFKDEFHTRLRFNRRGLVAMANAGKDDNGSQFFITLAATPELQNKHTIFGKVTGRAYLPDAPSKMGAHSHMVGARQTEAEMARQPGRRTERTQILENLQMHLLRVTKPRPNVGVGPAPTLFYLHSQAYVNLFSETIYNVLKLTEGLIGPDDRPEHPHKITSSEVLINPFTDIEPRVAAKPVEAPKKKKKERQGVNNWRSMREAYVQQWTSYESGQQLLTDVRVTLCSRNFGLLSFGEEAEEDEGEALEYRGKPKSTHDLLEDPKLSKLTAAELEEQNQIEKEPTLEEIKEKREETAAAVSSIRDKLKKRSPERERSNSPDNKRRKSESEEEEYYIGMERDKERRKERDRIRNEIKQLKKEMKAPKEDKKEEVPEEKESKKLEEDNEMYKKYIEEQEKYKKMKEKLPKKGAARSRRTKVARKPFKKKPWVKNLYENREYPDNYTDSKFLEDLRKNLYVEKKYKDNIYGPWDEAIINDSDDLDECLNDIRESFTLDLLAKFKNKLHAIKEKALMPAPPGGSEPKGGEEDEDLNSDDWSLLARDASTKGDDWFDIYDPRNPINKRKREKTEKKSKK
ncbi:hypothetical protein MSG28_015044 [Choristoneura fumiferana]|uniref:Uncharacterized protein n=1 Tax=Choristoneura fumiferana TaxID=7141 RepID=A0ACC0KYM2_CHOFU|nr:hypothetical protein MSG28_015044 [Choristoneura fumiferana]